MNFLKKTKVRNGLNSVFVTVFTTAILALFLMPFLYMALTSLKTQSQIAVLGSPIYPAAIPTVVYNGENTGTYTFKVTKGGMQANQIVDMNKYAGKELEVYTVPFKETGETRELALLIGFQKEAIFIDHKNPSADPILWNEGYYKALKRPWIFSPTWSNYSKVWTQIEFPRLLGNTMFYAFVSAIGAVISAIIVAFGFSRFRFPGRDFLFVVMIATIFLPGAVTIIPTFTFWTQLTRLGLGIGTGTWWPLILPHFFSNAYNVFLLRQFFMTLPRELDEAAMIDGASPLRILWSVIIPQSYPAIVAVSIFHIVFAWNDFFSPLIYLASKPELQPVSVALARYNTNYATYPQYIQAGALMALIIPLFLFVVAQRFFIQGIVITGVDK
ncbi:MAG: carbohydrate ABC transporter permease [Anaerolineales bacterium]|nr:carbohydrate ABC transporter permease [Anaerolineales bacterium]